MNKLETVLIPAWMTWQRFSTKKAKINRELKKFLTSLTRELAKHQAMQERFSGLGYYEQNYLAPPKEVNDKNKTTGCHRIIGKNDLKMNRYDYTSRNQI